MGLADDAPQAVLGLRHRNQVNVIGHQTRRPDIHVVFYTPFCHQINIDTIIFIIEKGWLTTITALGDVMGNTRGYDACDSCHNRRIAETKGLSIKYTVPRIPPEPPSIDDRIVNQYAFCSVMNDPCMVLDDWLEAYPGIARKIIIPAGLKWEIRDKLDQANINERVLFPGLDGLSRWLKRHYSPRI